MNLLKKIYISLSSRERLAFYAALALGCAALAVLFVVIFKQSTQTVPAMGGEYIEGILGQPTYANPVLAASAADRALTRLLFSNLKDLAEKIEVDKTGRAWTIRLKENLTWSDGTKLTSDDVIFTVSRIQDPDTGSPLFLSWQGATVNRLSELELQFNLVNPYAYFGDNIKNLYILPKHLFAETPSANWRLSEYNLKPVGSGPYVFQNYDKKSDGFINNYELKVNPRYAGTKPYLQNIGLRFFASTDELVKSFNNGEIDGFGTLDPQLLSEIGRSYLLTPLSLPNYYAVFFNQSQNLALKDDLVRTTLAAAVDRSELVNAVLSSHGSARTSPVLNVTSSDGIPDLSDLNQKLDAAGWPKNAEGLRQKTSKSGSVDLSFELTVPQIPFLENTAAKLVERWATLGVSVKIKALPPEEVLNNSIKNRDYQAILFGNTLSNPDDLYSFWHSSQRFYPGLNLALYNDKQTDQLLETIRQNMDSVSRAKQLMDLSRAIMSNAPATMLYSQDYLLITRRDLKGVASFGINEPADHFLAAPSWYLKTAWALK